MATFQEQVQDLTSLSVSDTAELSQFLKDGVIDVTNRCIALKPQEAENFQRESAEITSQAGINLGGARILSVVREDGTDNQWRKCRKISPSFQYSVTDVESLNYASKVNPAYMIGDSNKVSVFPEPGSNPNAFKVYYVNKDIVNGSGASLIHSHDDILYFPVDKTYLVVHYASMKLLQATMASRQDPIEPVLLDMPASLVDASIAFAEVTASTVATFDVDSFGTIPAYTPPVVTGDIQEITGTIVAGAAGNAGDQISFNHWYDVLADLIETEEDTELAAVQLQKINSYIGAYQAALNNQQAIFNDANVEYQANIQMQMAEYQADIQLKVKDADRATQTALQNASKEMEVLVTDYGLALQKYQAEVATYTADATASIQKYSASIQASAMSYKWLESQYAKIKGDYDAAFAIMAPKQQAPQGR